LVDVCGFALEKQLSCQLLVTGEVEQGAFGVEASRMCLGDVMVIASMMVMMVMMMLHSMTMTTTTTTTSPARGCNLMKYGARRLEHLLPEPVSCRRMHRRTIHENIVGNLSKASYAVHYSGGQQAEITGGRVVVAAVSAGAHGRVPRGVVAAGSRGPRVLGLACAKKDVGFGSCYRHCYCYSSLLATIIWGQILANLPSESQ
jgi:hypothetical protein